MGTKEGSKRNLHLDLCSLSSKNLRSGPKICQQNEPVYVIYLLVRDQLSYKSWIPRICHFSNSHYSGIWHQTSTLNWKRAVVYCHHVSFDLIRPAKRGLTIGWRFVVDVSHSMSKMREVETPTGTGKPSRIVQMTNLEWALQFVLWKVQELVRAVFPQCRYLTLLDKIFHNRKTDMCGVILVGTDGN